MLKLEALELARTVVDVASDKQAADIVLLDVRGICSFADYFVIATGNNERQLRTIMEEARLKIKKAGTLPHHEEGGTDSGWMLLDYGDVVVHLFGEEERAYYDLDGLWQKGKRLLTIQ